MNLESFLQLLPKTNKIQFVSSFKGELPKIGKHEINHLIELGESAVRAGRAGNAADWIGVALMLDCERAFSSIQKRRLFRPSQYVGQTYVAPEVARYLLNQKVFLKLSDKQIGFLEQAVWLENIYDILVSTRTSILQWLNHYHVQRPKVAGVPCSLIKTLLVFTDLFFARDYGREQNENPFDLSFYNKEEVAEGASYLIFLYDQHFGLSEKDFDLVDDDLILKHGIEKILADACRYRHIMEFEILIEHYGYTLNKGPKNWELQFPSEEFEKSLVWGYFQADSQKNADGMRAHRRTAGSLSLHDAMSNLLNELPDILFRVDDPLYPRYRLQVPEEFYARFGLDAIKGFFVEEVHRLMIIDKEQLLDTENLHQIEIRENLTMLDVFKIQRVFFMNYYLFTDSILKRHGYPSRELLHTISGLEEEDLLSIITQVVNKKTAKAFLDVFSWSPNSNEVLDLQYTPFIKVGSRYFIPLSIISLSSFSRNVFPLELKRNEKRLLTDGTKDPVADLLRNGYKSLGYTVVESGIPVLYHGLQTNIDFLAWNDHLIVISECKQNYLPANFFELRTAHSELKGARQQLDIIMSALSDKEFRKKLNKDFGLPLSELKIIPSITILNRMFNGSHIFGYPVRNVHDIMNFISPGTIRVGDSESSEIHVCSMWTGDKITTEDIVAFYQDHALHYGAAYDSMVPFDIIFHEKLVYKTYGVDIDLMQKNTKNRLRVVAVVPKEKLYGR